MITFESTIAISRSIEAVFSFVANPLNGKQWNSAVVDVKKLSSGPVGVGTEYLMTRQLRGAIVENTIEIVEFVKDKQLTVRTTSGSTPFVYHYHFEPDERGTRLSLQARGELGDIGGNIGVIVSIAPGFLLAGFVKRGVEANLRKLKSLLEC